MTMTYFYQKVHNLLNYFFLAFDENMKHKNLFRGWDHQADFPNS